MTSDHYVPRAATLREAFLPLPGSDEEAICRALTLVHNQSSAGPAIFGASPLGFIDVAPRARAMQPGLPIHTVIRHPLDRFLEAMAFAGLEDIDAQLAALDGLAPEEIDDPFRPVYSFIRPEWEVYGYRHDEDGFGTLAVALGVPALSLSPPNPDRPVATPAQAAAISAFYASDVALFEACETPSSLINGNPHTGPFAWEAQEFYRLTDDEILALFLSHPRAVETFQAGDHDRFMELTPAELPAVWTQP